MKFYLIAILVVWCGHAIAAEPIAKSEYTPAGHTTDSLDVVQQRIKAKQAILIDVREQGEWDAGHLRAAKLIPMSAVQADELTKAMKKQLSKKVPIYLHCRSGGRVLRVSQMLKDQGYDIRPLKAGYSKLLEAGFEPAKEPESPK